MTEAIFNKSLLLHSLKISTFGLKFGCDKKQKKKHYLWEEDRVIFFGASFIFFFAQKLTILFILRSKFDKKESTIII